MCGIIGFIGKSRDPAVSHKLSTILLSKTEIRGDDAAGFYASEEGAGDSAVLLSKKPMKSTDFINTEMWGAWKDRPIDLMIGHCRKSTCRGSENVNINNHPFVSLDYNTALVHNGNVPEFDSLKSSYDVMSDCDSEILLRMMERGSLYDDAYVKAEFAELTIDKKRKLKDLKEGEQVPMWIHRLAGLRDIFARISYGAMAVAIAERWADGTRALWLFRDKERPLNVVDMRNTLGQVYIVSEKKIWRETVEACPEVRKYCKNSTPIIEFPVNSIWLLTFKDNEFSVKKWKINRTRKAGTTFDEERPETSQLFSHGEQPRVIMDLTFTEHKVLPTVQEKKPPISNGTASTAIEVVDDDIMHQEEITETEKDDLIASAAALSTTVEANDSQKKTNENKEKESWTPRQYGTNGTNQSACPSARPQPIFNDVDGSLVDGDAPFWSSDSVTSLNGELTLGKEKIEPLRIIPGKKGTAPNKHAIMEDEEDDYRSGEFESDIPIEPGLRGNLVPATVKKNKRPDHAELDELANAIGKLQTLLASVESEIQAFVSDDLIETEDIRSITEDIIDFTRTLEASKQASAKLAMHA